MTNFDYIKSMSVDELASLLGCISEDIDENMRTINGQMIFDSFSDIREWLESECENLRGRVIHNALRYIF